MRTGPRGRLPDRRERCRPRAARDHPRHHARFRRDTTARARRRARQGEGPHPFRPARAADEALRIGLVDRVVDDAEVLHVAVGQGLAYARGPLALTYAKQAIDGGAALPIEAGLALEADLITKCFASEDGRHGLRSFAEKSQATFRGR
ncbi:enoyl-CoA hydratase-related protein [Amycolatopsis sp. RTGN1]|uniref:enoyl-CoA hydratase-related protein n=1 Tax=Amycolatopsis ponsaeliensis TaxID=2992142 RepID=UPI00254E41D8|nr:enoyl-CoA hydratase-related protein [Amycolatopsis sp. RTGN1]